MRFAMRYAIPIWLMAEVAVLVLVGANAGVLATLGLLLLATMAGIVLLRRPGRALAARMAAAPPGGQVSPPDLLAAAATMVAGLLLILPGFLSDLAALLLLIPAVRGALGQRLFGLARFGSVFTFTTPPGRAGDSTVDLDPADWKRSSDGRPGEGSPWRQAPGEGSDRLPPH